METSNTLEYHPSNPNDFIAVRDKLPGDLISFLTPYSHEDYIEMNANVYLSNSGNSGFGIQPSPKKHEVISVFAIPLSHEGGAAIEAAKQVGGKKLSCLGDHLRMFYVNHGFEVTEWYLWNDKFRPQNWNAKKYGKPNLYIMELREYGVVKRV